MQLGRKTPFCTRARILAAGPQDLGGDVLV